MAAAWQAAGRNVYIDCCQEELPRTGSLSGQPQEAREGFDAKLLRHQVNVLVTRDLGFVTRR
jgi:hypothetical protein